MPRRTLLALTALVLVLHWLVLQGVPLSWESAAAPAGPMFTTRSVAAQPQLPAAAALSAPAAPPGAQAPQPPKPPKKIPATPPRNSAPTAQAATNEPSPVAMATDNADHVAEAEAPTPSGAGTEHLAEAVPPVPAPPEAAPAALPPASAASSPSAAQEGAGVDITPPGGGAGASTAPPPVRLPSPVKLSFDVAGQAKKFDYQARAELVWQHDGARYEARQEISAFLVGSRTQRSTGMVTAQGLQPERFGDKNRSERAAHFDYPRSRVTFSANTPEAAIGPGAQDRLSVFIQLAGLLAATPDRFVPGTQLTLTTVSATSADRWTFTVEATETLNLPAGALPTLKLQRLPRRDYDQKAELWLAPSMGYLPVRIKITQASGDFADLRLRSSGPP